MLGELISIMWKFTPKKLQKKTSDYVNIEINTESDEKKFQKLFKKKQTIFLNGAWGSGKSTFIKKVAGKDYKLKYLNLWEQDSDYSIFSLALKVIHPKFYILERFFISIIFTGSVFGLSFLQLFILHKISFWIILFIIFSTVLVSVAKLMEVKSNYLDKKILTFKWFVGSKVILVIDDFDRLLPVQQEKVYKLLNLMHKKIVVIILGEYRSLVANKNSFFYTRL